MTVALVPNASVPPARGAVELAESRARRHHGPRPRSAGEDWADLTRRPRHAYAAVVVQPLRPVPVHRPARVRFVRWFCKAAVGLILGLRVEGRERFAMGPAIYCFNHLNWTDPIVLLAALPPTPKYAVFGPEEADMTKGARNRIISWAGFGIPYRPAKNDLIETTRRVGRILRRVGDRDRGGGEDPPG